MELTMLREERAREMAKNQNVVQSALHSNTKIESERDEALSELRDSKQQLAAALADLEIGKADIARITTGNNNLSHALEAFQDERHAEMELLDQQRKEAESAISCAHDAAMEALRQAHSAEMQQVQNAADLALKNKIGEMSFVEARIERLKSENNQTRRSLDEAIHRLQTSQEDVIDRALMKNILLDWCTRTSMSDKNKRHQVLELMANVLHFTDDEREKVHLTHMDIESVRSRVVGAFALPPSKADVEHLEGSNVGEKFLSFMLAETDDGF
jgi:chromosome segregation ATPase